MNLRPPRPDEVRYQRPPISLVRPYHALRRRLRRSRLTNIDKLIFHDFRNKCRPSRRLTKPPLFPDPGPSNSVMIKLSENFDQLEVHSFAVVANPKFLALSCFLVPALRWARFLGGGLG